MVGLCVPSAHCGAVVRGRAIQRESRHHLVKDGLRATQITEGHEACGEAGKSAEIADVRTVGQRDRLGVAAGMIEALAQGLTDRWVARHALRRRQGDQPVRSLGRSSLRRQEARRLDGGEQIRGRRPDRQIALHAGRLYQW